MDPQPVPTMPPPGWYPDPTGQPRWWDGTAWGPAAPVGPPGPSFANSRTLAILSHLGFVLGGFILPLVVYVTADRRDRFLRHHASEALNFQLTFLAVWLVVFAAWMATVVAGIGLSSGGGGAAGVVTMVGMLVVWGVMMLGMAAMWGFGILGAVRASQGRWWRYPVCIRFVKGAADPADVGWG